MLIIPFPSDGMPTSGQPWKWNSLTARDLFSCREKEKGECQLHRWQTLKYSAKRHINHVPEDPLKRTHSVIGDEKVPNSVAFTFLLPLQLNGHVPTNHHTVTRPILSTLLLQRVGKRQIYFSIAPPVRVENATIFLLLAQIFNYKATPQKDTFVSRVSIFTDVTNKEKGGTWTYLSSLLQLCQHNDRAASPLPDHSPEVLNGVLQRPLTCHVRVLLPITLHTHKYDYICIH